MGVSISLSNGSNVIAYETRQGGVAIDELNASFAPVAWDGVVASGPASWVGGHALANGGFTIEWQTGGQLLARDYNASGQATGQAYAWTGAQGFGAAGFASNAGGATTWLPNGDHVVSSETSNGASNYQVHVQLYSPQGAPIGPAFSETAAPISLFTAPVVAGLADGSYEAAWVEQANYASHLLVEHFTAQGNAAGQATLATYGGFSVIGSSGYALAGLADGGFAAAWTVQDNGSPTQVYAEEFTASGAPVGSATLLGTAASAKQAPVIDAESDGHYVVSWISPSGPEHQAFMDPATVAAATPAPAPTLSPASIKEAIADLGGAAVSGAETGGFTWPSAHSALHPLVSAAIADASHAIASLHAAHTPSFSFV